jgi:hypothetical protein
MPDWRTIVLALLTVAVVAAPSHAAKICAPEIVSVKIKGKAIEGRTLKSVVRVRCSR